MESENVPGPGIVRTIPSYTYYPPFAAQCHACTTTQILGSRNTAQLNAELYTANVQ